MFVCTCMYTCGRQAVPSHGTNEWRWAYPHPNLNPQHPHTQILKPAPLPPAVAGSMGWRVVQLRADEEVEHRVACENKEEPNHGIQVGMLEGVVVWCGVLLLGFIYGVESVATPNINTFYHIE